MVFGIESGQGGIVTRIIPGVDVDAQVWTDVVRCCGTRHEASAAYLAEQEIVHAGMRRCGDLYANCKRVCQRSKPVAQIGHLVAAAIDDTQSGVAVGNISRRTQRGLQNLECLDGRAQRSGGSGHGITPSGGMDEA